MPGHGAWGLLRRAVRDRDGYLRPLRLRIQHRSSQLPATAVPGPAAGLMNDTMRFIVGALCRLAGSQAESSAPRPAPERHCGSAPSERPCPRRGCCCPHCGEWATCRPSRHKMKRSDNRNRGSAQPLSAERAVMPRPARRLPVVVPVAAATAGSWPGRLADARRIRRCHARADVSASPSPGRCHAGWSAARRRRDNVKFVARAGPDRGSDPSSIVTTVPRRHMLNGRRVRRSPFSRVDEGCGRLAKPLCDAHREVHVSEASTAQIGQPIRRAVEF